MSFKTRLIVDQNEYNVLNVKFGLKQDTDATGRPSTVVRGGEVSVTVEGTGGTELFELMTNNFDRKDFEVVFFKRDEEAASSTLKGTEAYVVEYVRNFDSTGKNPLSETIVFSAKLLGMGNGEHDNDWPTK